jgi:FtsH-binding integral membrane protein
MTKEHSIRFRRIYSILLSISIVIAGICFIAACLSIYFTGERIYSREIVAQTFDKIVVPIYLCLALNIIDFVWEFLSPTVAPKIKPTKNFAFILSNLQKKKDFIDCDETLLHSINKERTSRKVHVIIRTILILACSILFLSYALNSKNFHQSEINASMIQAMCILIPCMIVPFGYAIFTAYHNAKSLQREIELVKQIPNASKSQEVMVSGPTTNTKETVLRLALLFVGIGVLLYGFISGGTIDVLTKAINICTECIGLG